MKTSLEPQDSDRVLRHLCELARATFTEDLPAGAQAGWSPLEVRLSGRPRPRRTLALGLGLAAAAVAALALGWRHQTPPSLGFRVVDEAGVAHAAPNLASAGRIEFSDGSQVAVAAEARASVTAIDARGARIRLEHGRLSAHFVHLPEATWSMAAGPYQILVTGTAFDVSWTPDTRTLELWIRHGSVLVKGPNAGEGLAVGAGQHLLASAASGQIVLDAMGAAASPAPPIVPTAPTPAADLTPAPSPPSERPPMSPREPSRALRPAPSPRGRTPGPSLPWPQSLARGDFQSILDEAARQGLDEVLSGATSADLAALADAARYRRRNDLAQRTLLAQRQRFPQTQAGRDAAFFLGTLDESRVGREARTSALQWYGRYLAESPVGSYAGQALGRRMVLFDSLHDRTVARETAASYLAKFPAGPYASKARHIVESSQ